ncbi:hypothetical protein BV898_01548 [Hypsibius exemplaris]|uniref:Uncharacterized protein n=1 Tax=Hypsibius exemplaris TaxID=2072580 RepID=A0A1W0XAD4_HYPEX|nr:hypothetical protein BV898_01548 [Hypsibius exemplaris]
MRSCNVALRSTVKAFLNQAYGNSPNLLIRPSTASGINLFPLPQNPYKRRKQHSSPDSFQFCSNFNSVKVLWLNCKSFSSPHHRSTPLNMPDKVTTVTKEKTDIKDGKSTHEFKSETKGCGQDSKEHTKEEHTLKNGKETHKISSEVKH